MIPNYNQKSMDNEKEQIRFNGIFMESFSIILSCKLLFTQITLVTIFPLSLLFLSHLQILEYFFADIQEKGSFESPNIVWSEEIAFWSFKVAYVAFLLVHSMASTSAVVLAAACVYARKEVGFIEVMIAVPKVWKRLMVTFGWSLIIVLVYNMAAFSVLGGGDELGPARISTSGPLYVVYFVGFVYVSIIWHLASVVSVLEEDCGVEAMIKSMGMVKGRMVISVAVFLLLNLSFMLVQVVFLRFVVVGELFWRRILWGISCFFFLSFFTLLGLVVQTVIYLICKSNNYGPVDKSWLANHLGVYLGDYASLGSIDVHLDQC